ncbi:hypothetical protein LV89_01690 [Arcicella aurantiaca]|uniref:Uncharacterized protein n=1 Tax=Arcicella aurantiaca TaxID=591202 RepID=A0A316EB74_9BACT|nr:hypothetical protein [Arcicella aurantiaca]PWK27377.1 hypothetical protein LV89_01690 [Arcicella aurantiaca]
MTQIFSGNSLLQKTTKRLTMGLLTCLSIGHLASAQDLKTKPTIVSSLTDNGITTTTYSNGQVVKTVADGYYLDSAFYKNSNVLRSTKPKSYWKLTDRVGVAIPFCKEGEDKSLFLKPGAYNTLSINRFWGILGLGLMGGYQNFGVSDDYKGADGQIAKNINIINATRPLSERIAPSSVKYDTQGNYEDFYLLIGPALALPVSKKINVDVDLKGGLFNSSAPRFGAVTTGALGADAIIFRTSPSASKNQLGGLLSVDILYNFAKNWAVGLNGQGFLTSTPYTVDGGDVTPSSIKVLTREYTRTHGGCNFGLALSHTFGEKTGNTIYSLLPPPPAPVVCAIPTLQGENGMMYDNGSTTIPSFRWKSTSATPENEEYIFKLYKADGSGTPIYQQTTKNANLSLPANVSLVNGDDCSFYYYTVQSSVEGKCLSEASAASFGYRAKPVVQNIVAKPVEDQYMFKIFGGSTATKYFGGSSAYKPRRKARKATTVAPAKPADAVAVAKPKRLVPRRKKSVSGATGVKTYSSTVNYENVATDPNIKWPKDLPLPKNPAVYEYEVQRLNAGDCKPTGTVAKYKFYIDPKKPEDIRIIPDKPKK